MTSVLHGFWPLQSGSSSHLLPHGECLLVCHCSKSLFKIFQRISCVAFLPHHLIIIDSVCGCSHCIFLGLLVSAQFIQPQVALTQ
ncbi:hypothetical protein MUK42_24497 [Musa troglodytarum]|uniref:Uncharacterized protein n=1 Tax=Musa troglodytarum TaxID=320322 RepID=A0A9E7GE22_9LILI|nr:hypothetical protein MUK42_24497 [Musa troglodytarum]